MRVIEYGDRGRRYQVSLTLELAQQIGVTSGRIEAEVDEEQMRELEARGAFLDKSARVGPGEDSPFSLGPQAATDDASASPATVRASAPGGRFRIRIESAKGHNFMSQETFDDREGARGEIRRLRRRPGYDGCRFFTTPEGYAFERSGEDRDDDD